MQKIVTKLLVVFGLITINISHLYAQDPQFSQYYAAPLYLNPAFAGSTELSRVGLNFRSQWPSLQANFTTASVYFDHFFEDYNSGVGVILNGDREGLAGLQSISLGLQYAYQLRINEWLTFRPGAQVAFYNRDINFDKLVFGDQLDETGVISDVSAEQFNTGTSKFFVDLSLGGLIFSENFYFGYAAHHVNTPNQSLVGEESRLQMKSTFHGGYRILLPAGFRRYGFNDKGLERSLTPTFQYKKQGNFDQLDLGMYLTYEPIVFGMWYRGLPVRQLDEFPNNESVIALVGLMVGDINIGYSFDYTISGLGIQSGGAHEISLVYHFSLRDPSKPPRSIMSLPCPRF
ncbi:type IX secretion system membrane protein PorP/SprF [Porifericola rhodea]|uniref:PorP/SprF family type IX secretion system membrane protein n=1 Tax=Porifericola rhodea TaxID=930972 RepID=UPI00266709A5|nr:type IX secretion system membrane protein PorP/SprF [Porifericola rhodea]WKN32759.1 type IX secretion system membrane protein PorP/SprF [Porifericola rhodea]